MRKIFFVIAAGAIVAAASPAAAAKPAPASQAVTPKAPVYCLEVEPMTGSRLNGKECKTKADWARDGVKIDDMMSPKR